MKVFLSHASADKMAVDALKEMFDVSDESGTTVFYSSDNDPKFGVMGGRSISRTLDDALETSDVIVLLVTKSYLRSPYCLYEACLSKHFWQKRMERLQLLFVFSNDEVRQQRFPDEFRPPRDDLLTITAGNPQAGEALWNALKAAGCQLKSGAREMADAFCGRLKVASLPQPTSSDVPTNSDNTTDKGKTAVPKNKFIGMTDREGKDVWSYVETGGIEAIKTGFKCDKKQLEARLFGGSPKEPIDELYFVAPTGARFLLDCRDILRRALSEGANLYVILAERGSEFMMDLAECEALKVMSKEGDVRRHDSEQQANKDIFDTLEADIEKETTAISTGTITRLSAATLLRQAVFLAKGKRGTLQGWMTCMLPPFLNIAEQVPTFVFSGTVESGGLGKSVYEYCKALRAVAEGRKGRQKDVAAETRRDDASAVREYWRKKNARAREFMGSRESCRNNILIEVASQHPLLPDGRPNAEFQARLDKAVELYGELTSKGNTVRIYVPGSPHVGPGKAEKTSLSEAGCRYLRERGLPDDVLCGDEANRKYKGEDGVYNSADECFVAVKLFQDGWHGRLLCVCAPNQVLRKTLFYLEFGVVPECHAVTVENGYHADTMREVFDSLHTVLYDDHDWQNRNGECFRNSRMERRPAYEPPESGGIAR